MLSNYQVYVEAPIVLGHWQIRPCRDALNQAFKPCRRWAGRLALFRGPGCRLARRETHHQARLLPQGVDLLILKCQVLVGGSPVEVPQHPCQDEPHLHVGQALADAAVRAGDKRLGDFEVVAFKGRVVEPPLRPELVGLSEVGPRPVSAVLCHVHDHLVGGRLCQRTGTA